MRRTPCQSRFGACEMLAMAEIPRMHVPIFSGLNYDIISASPPLHVILGHPFEAHVRRNLPALSEAVFDVGTAKKRTTRIHELAGNSPQTPLA